MIRSEDSKKWIRSFVLICSAILGYICIKFFMQLGEWFDLESQISNFRWVTWGLGIFVGAGGFFYLLSNQKTSQYMEEVYGELTKVVWPQAEQVFKVTIGLVIALIFISLIFVAVDWGFRALISLLY